jgi:hypothetical protein
LPSNAYDHVGPLIYSFRDSMPNLHILLSNAWRIILQSSAHDSYPL